MCTTDANELVVPAQMENALFVTTNHITNNGKRNNNCNATTPCQADTYVRLSNDGVLKGRCLDTSASIMNGTKSSSMDGTNVTNPVNVTVLAMHGNVTLGYAGHHSTTSTGRARWGVGVPASRMEPMFEHFFGKIKQFILT